MYNGMNFNNFRNRPPFPPGRPIRPGRPPRPNNNGFGFLGPFILGGLAGGLTAPLFYNRPNYYYPPYIPPYFPF